MIPSELGAVSFKMPFLTTIETVGSLRGCCSGGVSTPRGIRLIPHVGLPRVAYSWGVLLVPFNVPAIVLQLLLYQHCSIDNLRKLLSYEGYHLGSYGGTQSLQKPLGLLSFSGHKIRGESGEFQEFGYVLTHGKVILL